MIKNIYANGPYIQVDSSGQSYNTPYIDMSRPSAGMVRWNNNQFEVYDGGSSWMPIGGNGQAMISLRHNADTAIMWVEHKMQEEARWKSLAERHPAVADAMDHLKEAQARLQVVTALVEEETKS
jgi:hypothetical protein